MQNALPTFTFATSTTSTVAQFRVAAIVVITTTIAAEVFMINLVRKTREFAMLKIDGINFAHDRKWDQSKVENFGAPWLVLVVPPLKLSLLILQRRKSLEKVFNTAAPPRPLLQLWL
mgnify:CR=1 FL=1